ncbi:tetratricopeptide repeat protein [Streptomyces phaeochromogenes]|uniref:tetratricopeptide repeat protein n=1 Tax=Streptomyces phaeochromogenes TaxID=1923 RepID=UPI0033D932A4
MSSYGYFPPSEHGSEVRQRQWDVFISHARKDAIIAKSLADALMERGRSVWMDTELRPGDSLQAIDQALRSSGVVIILLSPSSLSSSFHRYEVENALQSVPKGNVIPIAVGDVDLQALPLWLLDRQLIHLRDYRQVESLVRRLLPRIDATLGESNQSPEHELVMGEMPNRVPLVGVREYLQQLRSRTVGITWIIGEPGAGKTSLAREYAYQARNDLQFIFWLSARGSEAGEICGELQELDRTVFDAAGHGLVVVDELDAVQGDRRQIVELLGNFTQSQRVLITTRHAADARLLGSQEQEILTIGLLSRAAVSEYLDVLTEGWQQNDRQKLKELAQHLPGSPVMLRLVMNAFKFSPLHHLSEISPTLEGAIGETLQVLTGRLSDRARRRLFILSFCSDFLTLIRSQENWENPEDGELFSALLEWGICIQRGDNTFFTHELVVDFLRRMAPREALEDAISYVAMQLPDPEEVEAQEVMGSVITLSDLTDLPLRHGSAIALLDLLIWQASVWRAVGEPRRAEHASRRASSLAAEVGDPALQIRALNLKSALAFDQGRLVEACAIERRTAALASRELGPDHPISVASEANLAISLRALGELTEATSLMRRVVKKSRSLLPIGHPDRVAALTNLAICLREAGSLEEAMTLLDEAYSQAANDSARLNLNQVRAALLTNMGRLEEAAEILRGTVIRAAKVGPSGRSESLTAQANLAMVYARLGRVDEALSLQAEVLERFEFLHGPAHPATLNARNNFGVLLIGSGDHERALQLLTQVASEREQLLGRNHPDTLRSRIILAREMTDAGDREEALRAYRSLLPDVIRVFGPDSVLSLSIREEWADQLNESGDLRAARLAYKELLADVVAALPTDHPLVQRVQSRVTS